MTIPADLTQEEKDQVEVWVRKQRKKGKLARLRGTDLDDHIEACLDWHRALPERDRRKNRSDWAAAVRNWIRLADERKAGGGPISHEYIQKRQENDRMETGVPANVISMADRIGRKM